MLRVSKLTDYGTVVMAYLASHSSQACNAKEIAEKTKISLPTVSKLLKQLTRHGLLDAKRGIKGGYSLAIAAEKISLATIINAFEGDIAFIDCSNHTKKCTMETSCAISSNWRLINNSIHTTLSKITLADMTQPLKPLQIHSPLKVNSITIQE